MWAVSETDMKGLAVANVSSNVAIWVSAFFLGIVSNILLDYGGNATLTPVQEFMLNKGTWMFGGAAMVFLIFGCGLAYYRHSMWDQIKKESRPIQRP